MSLNHLLQREAQKVIGHDLSFYGCIKIRENQYSLCFHLSSKLRKYKVATKLFLLKSLNHMVRRANLTAFYPFRKNASINCPSS